MKKRILVFLLVLASALSLWAGKYNDIGFSLGLGTAKLPGKELTCSYGIEIGITNRTELDIWGISDIVPQPGRDTILGVELAYSLIGERNTGSKVSGINLNTIVSAGGFYSFTDGGAGVTVGIVPLAIGSPSISKREKILKTNLGWDFVNSKLLVTFSLLDIDVYVKGTFRDFT